MLNNRSRRRRSEAKSQSGKNIVNYRFKNSLLVYCEYVNRLISFYKMQENYDAWKNLKKPTTTTTTATTNHISAYDSWCVQAVFMTCFIIPFFYNFIKKWILRHFGNYNDMQWITKISRLKREFIVGHCEHKEPGYKNWVVYICVEWPVQWINGGNK